MKSQLDIPIVEIQKEMWSNEKFMNPYSLKIALLVSHSGITKQWSKIKRGVNWIFKILDRF